MPPFSEYFRGVEAVCLLWVVSVLALGVLVFAGVRKLSLVGLLKFHREETGAAYTLSYVMAFPVFGLLLALIAESTLMLTTKIGTVYAAYAAARAGIVWSSAQPGEAGSPQVLERARSRMRRSAVHALVPFSSANPKNRMINFGLLNDNRLPEYLAAYQVHYGDVSDKAGYLTRKYLFAAAAVNVDVENLESVKYGEDLIVTVRFKYPFILPGIGRIFGTKTGNFYSAELQSRVELQTETPNSESGGLGIEYHSD